VPFQSEASNLVPNDPNARSADIFVLRRIRDIVAATEKVAAGELGRKTGLGFYTW